MKWIVLNGAYPTNPIWQDPLFLIMIFEVLVISIECSLIIGNWDYIIKKKRRAILIIVLANFITFGVGALFQLYYGALGRL